MRAERSRVSALLREPLTHFLLIGAAMFLAFQVGGGREAEKQNEIIVTRGAIESLALSWEKTRQRPPTAAEREGLIESYIRQEVLYREALAMGLEREDTIIKRSPTWRRSAKNSCSNTLKRIPKGIASIRSIPSATST